jgi:ketosteroid isomerase-like protein
MSRENVEVVRRALDAWNAGDPAVAAAVLDPDVEWQLPENFPDTGVLQGRERVIAELEALLDSWDEFTVEVRELIDAGDRVVALVRYRGRAATTGLILGGQSMDAQVWTLRGGRAVEVRMYSGTDSAFAAAGIDRRA